MISVLDLTIILWHPIITISGERVNLLTGSKKRETKTKKMLTIDQLEFLLFFFLLVKKPLSQTTVCRLNTCDIREKRIYKRKILAILNWTRIKSVLTSKL